MALKHIIAQGRRNERVRDAEEMVAWLMAALRRGFAGDAGGRLDDLLEGQQQEGGGLRRSERAGCAG